MATPLLTNVPIFRREGETVILKAGIQHKFWNAGIEPQHITMEVNPVDNIIYSLVLLMRITC